MMARLRDGRRIAVTAHALDRYLERVLAFNGDRDRAVRHLAQAAASIGVLTYVRPEWACSSYGNPAEDDDDSYLMLGDDICLLVQQGRALTVLCRGHMSDVARADRNRRRSYERARRQTKRKLELAGRPAPEEWAA